MSHHTENNRIYEKTNHFTQQEGFNWNERPQSGVKHIRPDKQDQEIWSRDVVTQTGAFN